MIPTRTSFAADSSVIVVRQFGIAVVDKRVPKQPFGKDSSTLSPGDTVYLMQYQGEDWFTAMIRGRVDTIYAFWGDDPPGMERPWFTDRYGRVTRNLATEWWVRVRLADGASGWINMTGVESVRGPQPCSEGN